MAIETPGGGYDRVALLLDRRTTVRHAEGIPVLWGAVAVYPVAYPGSHF